MKKQSKRRIIIGVAILLVLLILGIVLINNVINSKNFSQQQYFSTTQDAGSNLVAKYIKTGIREPDITYNVGAEDYYNMEVQGLHYI